MKFFRIHIQYDLNIFYCNNIWQFKNEETYTLLYESYSNISTLY